MNPRSTLPRVLGMVLLLAGVATPGASGGRAATDAPASGAVSADAATVPPGAERGFAGSRACAGCHAEAFAAWSRSGHAQLVKAADSLSVLGDFGIEKTIVLDDLRLRFLREGELHAVEIEDAQGTRRYPIEATLGGYALQAYLARMPDGRLSDLPVVWDVQSRRWLGAVTNPLDGRRWDSRVWETDCAGCHALRGTGEQATPRILEFGVGCESCHGPGAGHVAARRSGEVDPYPDPRTWSPEVRRDLCASCHVPGIEVPADWRPGERLPEEAYGAGTVPLRGTLTPRHWPDGSERVPFASLGTSSAPDGYHGRRGECMDCHLPHGGTGFGSLKKPAEDNSLCADCHSDIARDLPAHTGHRPVAESVGSRCVECHMPRTNTHYSGWLADHNLRRHEMGIPDPRKTVRYGMPNACNLCHVDRSPAWAQESLDALREPGNEKSGGEGR